MNISVKLQMHEMCVVALKTKINKLIFSSVVLFLTCAECINLPHVERKLLKSGFHRDLQTSIRIPQHTLATTNDVVCLMLFTETLPSGAYVDPYQLNSLKPHGGPDVVVVNSVDIEKPEFESDPIKVLTFSNMSLVDEVWTSGYTVPVHLRYHSVSTEQFATVAFTKPEIAIRCVNHQLGMVHYGYQGASVTIKDELCDSNRKLLCDWTFIQYQTDTDLTVEVPLGQSEHYLWVTAGTVLTTLCGCIVLIMKTLNTHLKTKES